jgi:hypothetical protein
VEHALKNIGNRFLDHPGFMWSDGGFKVLHADWPLYSIGRGVAPTSAELGDLPPGSEFFPIDDIDGCTLFVAERET